MSQENLILDHFKSGKSLTPLESLKLYGIMRLGARCFELRQKGYNIQSELIKGENGKHYARYWLSDEPIPTEQESAIINHNLAVEDKVNRKAFERNRQYCFI